MASRPADPVAVAAARSRFGEGQHDHSDLRLLTRHFLAVLAERAPGKSVEVRVPPYGAVQCVPGVRHTRGTPAAVVECDALTWVRLALGDLTWAEASELGLHASGERSDLSPWLPLYPTS
jgi:hypothetical protein